ncbi:hypothetical protein [Shewanella xiamenensis]|uniref:hypothetical protein n=1 Tax=Shewanella xiamenensis TaxID=332186 RepID=UPI002E7BCB5F|nr:hypothetical protein [Shewanella xiamenensis]
MLAQLRGMVEYLESLTIESSVTKSGFEPMFKIKRSKVITGLIKYLGLGRNIGEVTEEADKLVSLEREHWRTSYLPRYGEFGYDDVKAGLIAGIQPSWQKEEGGRDYFDEAIWFSMARGVEAAATKVFIEHPLFIELSESRQIAGRLASEPEVLKQTQQSTVTPIAVGEFSQKGTFAVQYEMPSGQKLLVLMESFVNGLPNEQDLETRISGLGLDCYESLRGSLVGLVVSTVNPIHSLYTTSICSVVKRNTEGSLEELDLQEAVGAIFFHLSGVRREFQSAALFKLFENGDIDNIAIPFSDD